jgi:nucleoside-diphosphate-sugar epimerase
MLMRCFRKPRLLIVGCGDVGLRLAALAQPRFRVIALSSSPERLPLLRAAGIVALSGDLDQQASLRRLRGLARWVAMLAPPPPSGAHDKRSRHLAAALGYRMINGGLAPRLVYASTSGVYGDCGGARVAETRPPRPQTPRAARRIDAEQCWRGFGQRRAARVSILRIPGIYDAAQRSPLRRLQQGLPVLRAEDDVHTNHIHADDLARLLLRALFRGAPGRVYNASDASHLRLGDYLDLAARLYGLPELPRVARAQARASGLSELALSFMGESRQLDNARLQHELGFEFDYPDVRCGLLGQPRRRV